MAATEKDKDRYAKHTIASNDPIAPSITQSRAITTNSPVTIIATTNAKKPPKYVGDYVMFETLGKGAWGKVRRAEHIQTKDPFAIKIIYRYVLDRKMKNGLGKLKSEFELVRKLDHPNIIHYYELFEKGEKVYLVMELCLGQSLESFRASYTQPYLAMDSLLRLQYLNTIRGYMRQLFQALKYLQSQNVAHHDLKPGNLLISTDGVLKLCDFGVAEQYHGGSAASGKALDSFAEQCTCFFGTPAFQPPEIAGNVTGAPFSGPQADIWSAGIVLYNLLTGSYPYQAETVYLLLKKISEAPSPVIPTLFDMQLENLLKSSILTNNACLGMLAKDPRARITVDDALAHPWLLTTVQRPSIGRSICDFFIPTCLKKVDR